MALAKYKIVNDDGGFSPISILPALSKIAKQLTKDVLQPVRASIYEFQHTFNRGCSVATLQPSLTDSISADITIVKLRALISPDLSEAFNSTYQATMIKNLKVYFDFVFQMRPLRTFLGGRNLWALKVFI